MLDPDDPVTLRRISDLQRAQPTDETLKALIGTLSTKLELCGRLPFLAYQAEQEGFKDVAEAFRNLAAVERRSLVELLVSLKYHLGHAVEALSSETAR